MRSGAQALALLATPLNVAILRALAARPKQQAELRRETGSPAQTTLRAQLQRLAAIGTIEKRRRNHFPGVLEYELTPSGRELLLVVDVLERWLTEGPGGPLPLGGREAKAAIKALTEGWSSTVLRALAAGPLSLTELDGVIAALSYPSLERRLTAMRLSGQIRACNGSGRGTPYAVTDWLRRGVAPLASAARWERRHCPADTAPLLRLDLEALFLLAVPLLRLPADLSGECGLAADMADAGEARLVGVMVEVGEGEVRSCTTRPRESSDAWALGTPAAWLNAIVAHDTDQLEQGGDCRLAAALTATLHETLFAEISATALDSRPSIGEDGAN